MIALSEKNTSLVSEIEQKFINAGYKYIILSNAIDLVVEKIQQDKFVNNAYMDCSYEVDEDFSEFTSLVKAIAFYLPQFHEIPENNEWWGEGFTEWTNTSKAKPKFKGHYQPREPHDDLGYYDLSDLNVIRKQAELARRHGIYGWCIYYYWFSGRKILSKPIDLLWENKDIDINFCLCWCNESWTKIWVGDNTEELIKCEYRDDDPEIFIDDLKKYIDDKRYIRFNGKPLIIIYKTQYIPNIQNVISRWRKRALTLGIGEISVFSVVIPYSTNDMELEDCFDGETEFSPARYASKALQLTDKHGSDISSSLYRYTECIEDYKRVVEAGNQNIYLSCMCGWDNTPRYDKQFQIYDLEFSLKHFYDLVKYITDNALTYNKEFIFVFAWNEWAEGAYLEPDKKFGYSILNTLSKAICGLPFEYNHRRQLSKKILSGKL